MEDLFESTTILLDSLSITDLDMGKTYLMPDKIDSPFIDETPNRNIQKHRGD